MVKTEMMDLDLQLHQQLLLAITFTWLMWEILQLSYQCRDRQRRQANKTTTFQPSFLIRTYTLAESTGIITLSARMDAQQPAQARQQHDYFCQHCGKGFNAAGMLSHNRDVHPRLFRDKKAGKCSLCWSLYPTKAATEIHELDFHGGRNMVNPKVVEDI